MTRFQGFDTMESAKAYQKKNGGMLCYAYTKSGRKSNTYTDYMYAVKLGGLDEKKYPYCLQWGNV